MAVGTAELCLRAFVPPSRAYFVMMPGANRRTFVPPGMLHGVAGVAHFRVNRDGVRGRDFGRDGAEFRILAVGGSTTQCAALDDSLAWPHLLESGLGSPGKGRALWVGNVGRDGATTRDHVVQLKYLLAQYPPIDVVVALVGVNDMLQALHQGSDYELPAPITEPAAERAQLDRAFVVVPSRIQDPVGYAQRDLAWYKATALWQVARRARASLQARRDLTAEGTRWVPAGLSALPEARRLRQAASQWIDSVPLERPLVEYRRNLNAMADIAAQAGVRLVLVTQPSVWRDRMSEHEQRLLWFGWLGATRLSARAYFTVHALHRAMTRYNEALLQFCLERGLECVDAAAVLPPDTTAMYDDVHFNAWGSRLLAEVLASHFRTRPPFARGTAVGPARAQPLTSSSR